MNPRRRPSRALAAIFAVAILSGAGADDEPRSERGQYNVVRGWPHSGKPLGAVSGVGVDSHGHVLVFHRNDRQWPDSDQLAADPIRAPTVAILDPRSGDILAEWGDNLFAMPQGLTVDAEDNVWLTDVALNQVYKFSHDGRLLLTLGERGVPGADSDHFNRPTAVAVAPDGAVFVTDGYRNTRVMKFSAKGRFLFQWGTPGAGPGQFDVPHGIAVDRAGRLYVADRGNQRVQIFEENGGYIGEWSSARIGRPYGVAVAPNGNVVVADGGDQSQRFPQRSGVAILKSDGSFVERFGRWGHRDGELAMAHDVAVGRDGAIYVGEIEGARVQKFVRR
ncbi:MAG TPA: peptidyl-alpha-hydroxyglycine alpha-amidating lyase family protein [Nevskiaceae bacterium]|nr:peptidyl-alpha-hydroxyglycine alpha-amidating lyase family protein [Nevskiaceae bacterium]